MGKHQHEDSSPPVFSIVSLGCAKNEVDSEFICGALMKAGFALAEDPRDSDICLVNTCGFIEAAREESAAVLNDLVAARSDGYPLVIAATGCLVERIYGCPEMDDFLTAADARIGFADYARLPEICQALLAHVKPAPPVQSAAESYAHFVHNPRLRLGAPHTAYLKLSEGCSRGCRFCSIPQIRGPQASRPIEDLLEETARLVRAGAREINLIAQDTTNYGKDLYGKPRLVKLLRKLADTDHDVWFRLLYAYPTAITDDILDTLASDERFCRYLDIPLQHIADPILAGMGRGTTKAETLKLIDRIHTRLPGAVLRTTFIVGFPGESEHDFEELYDFVREGHFLHMGVFTYSIEPLTAAADVPDAIPPYVKQQRSDQLMIAQLGVSREKLNAYVGTELPILTEPILDPSELLPAGTSAYARGPFQAPEVDGRIFLRADDHLHWGEFMRARIVKALDYDLIGEVV